jgi:hypothetical protein
MIVVKKYEFFKLSMDKNNKIKYKFKKKTKFLINNFPINLIGGFSNCRKRNFNKLFKKFGKKDKDFQKNYLDFLY